MKKHGYCHKIILYSLGDMTMRFSIIKRQPSYFFENIHEDLNRFLRDTFGETDLERLSTSKMPRFWRPALEIKETDDKYKIKAELPGIDKENINVDIEENQVIIKGETEKCEEKEGENMHTSEFRYGKFYRSIPLENPINTEESSAEFKNGVLHMELKKLETSKPEAKKLEIK